MGRHRKSRSRSREKESSRSRHRDSAKQSSSSLREKDYQDREKVKDHGKPRESRKSSRSPKSIKGKSRDRKHSSSSSSSSDSDNKLVMNKDLLEKLEKERQRVLAEKKKWKEQMKALETPEEKRKRRLLKKQSKEMKRKEQMGWDNELLQYTNSDNPFGDSNLLEKFVWKKKFEKEGRGDMSQEEIERELRMKQLANRDELEKVKARRLEREKEKEAREDETADLQRTKEAEQFKEWQQSEDQFHLEQAKLRSAIRIQDGRAKPVDVLAKYINSENDPEAVEMNEPYFYLMESSNLDYWNDLMVIVEDEVRAMRKIERSKRSDNEAAMGRQEGIHTAVAQDVASIFKNKTAPALLALKSNIEKKIAARQEGVDISYWESLLSQLKAHIARARLRDRHGANLKRKLELLKAQQGLIDTAAAEATRLGIKTEPTDVEVAEKPSIEKEESQGEEEEESGADGEESIRGQAERDLLEPCLAAYESGRYSPVYLEPSQIDPTQLIYTEDDDMERLEFARARVQGRGVAVGAADAEVSLEERAMRGEASKGMSADEAIFSVESAIDKPVYLWSDKYRPRKPRYFNRVHTGFEWNKYNQTHYDMDNPPPKIVQGYKFNIFFPDLIDKNSTPQYTITPCADNKDFGILRFRAGPPYEDIAFKIVNREWEYSYKKGFRCQFHNNIMQLWFHFKRYRYRR
ncbi:hypothetical protein GHT06_008482 [Daphnia sinensis]|uniref:Splicing factor Cactin n=1 Tax=Daphnia sinensis TaxID=1820382 RepID=A0AAD5L1G6_9CRUS|nr:hypothetical protein GHT06_008482 [Daphnia sinensis]